MFGNKQNNKQRDSSGNEQMKESFLARAKENLADAENAPQHRTI
jgi:hypothetical protein